MDDLISRQAVSKKIEKIRQDALMMDDTRRASIIMIGMNLCEEAVRNQPSAQPEPQWIPISKKTNPTKSGWYLVTVHEDATNENKRFTGIAEFNATNGMWYDIDEPTDMYLRWMPLPEPYRGGEE